MKIDLSQNEPVIEATDLAKYLDLTPEAVKDLMRAGAITSLFETGVDEHAGSHRLTFTYRTIRVRFTCDSEGNVLKTARFSIG